MAYIEISKSCYFHNLTQLSQQAGGISALSVVLKDNAYGHGLLNMAALSNEFGIQRAIVRTVDEADQIASFFGHIIILSPGDIASPHDSYGYVANSLEALKKFPSKTPIHLKIDTGMHRSGISENELQEAFDIIQSHQLILEGVMTHYRSADELSSEFFWQRENWKSIKAQVITLCKSYDLPRPLFHSANSAALLRDKHYDDDFARCGIGIYGYCDLPAIFNIRPLKPVLSLWAKRLATRTIPKGARIGYGGACEAKKDMTISTYDVGYGDGLMRYNAKNEAPQTASPALNILGRVSMDAISLECSEEKVCVINDARHFATIFDTITYDILVKLSYQLERKIVN